jgi:sugar-specific transcriptional regulator TrmB/DNA-binding CsgD family transcriptional regulator
MMDLAGIGITADAERVYRYLLAHQEALAADVATSLSADRDTIDAAIQTLADQRLIRFTAHRGLHAVDPAVGVERLVEERLARLNEELRAAADTRGYISALTALRQAPAAANPALDIEKVEGLDEVRSRLEDLAFFAHDEVLSAQPGDVLTVDMLEAARPLDLRCLRRGVTLRTVAHARAVQDRPVAEYVLELIELGAEIRLVEHPIERMVIFDRSVAVVPFDPGSSARGAVVVRQPGLVASMVALFDRIWERATDARSLLDAAAESGTAPSGHERQVLRLLLETDTDEVGARLLGVSVRTYRRYVADLMARLGASSRFQAAALAKDQGWI